MTLTFCDEAGNDYTTLDTECVPRIGEDVEFNDGRRFRVRGVKWRPKSLDYHPLGVFVTLAPITRTASESVARGATEALRALDDADSASKGSK